MEWNRFNTAAATAVADSALLHAAYAFDSYSTPASKFGPSHLSHRLIFRTGSVKRTSLVAHDTHYHSDPIWIARFSNVLASMNKNGKSTSDL